MKRLIPILMVLIPCSYPNASAQSLAEIAKREKARRAELKTQEAPSYNERDLRLHGTAPRLGVTQMARLSPIELETGSGEGRTQSAQDEPSVADLETLAAEAFEAEDYSKALALYEEVLSRDPGNTRALYYSAKLLSWEKRYEESIQRYQRLEATEPGHQRVAVEKAHVLLWDQQFGPAAKVLEEVLIVQPGNREARLNLARSLAGAGKLVAARAEFNKLLEQNRYDVDAMLGIAQTYHWSGAGEIAREWYERALAIEPGRWEAEVGLGYLDVWSDPVAAEKRSALLAMRFPDEQEVMKLREESRRARSPSIELSHDQLRDTHKNELNTTRVEGGFGLSSTMDLRVGAGQYRMSFDGDFGGNPGSGLATSAYTILGMPTGAGQKLSFRVGVDRLESTTGAVDYTAIGGVSWAWGQGRRWQGMVSAQRDPFRYTTASLDEGIIVTALAASAARRIGERWLLDGEVGSWRISDNSGRDNNSRISAQAQLRYQSSIKDFLYFEPGYGFQYFGYAENWGLSFFSPSYYRSHRGWIRTHANLGSRFDFHMIVEAGIQSYDQIRNEPMFVGTGVLGFRLGGGYKLEVFGVRGDYLLLSNFPVTSEQFGVRVRWRGDR